MFSKRECFCNLSGSCEIPIAGDILRGGISASRHPSARAIINWPASSAVAKPAVTPVDLTTKSKSSSLSTLHFLKASRTVSRTSSVTASFESSIPQTVLPKTSSLALGGLMSRVILTVLFNK